MQLVSYNNAQCNVAKALTYFRSAMFFLVKKFLKFLKFQICNKNLQYIPMPLRRFIIQHSLFAILQIEDTI